MALREFEAFHGMAILRAIAAAGGAARIAKHDEIGSGCYSVDNVGFLVKYATDRVTPWQFTFNPEQRIALETLARGFKRTGVALVCNRDSVIVLTRDEVALVLGDAPKDGRILIHRKPRGMAHVRGSVDDLPLKKADSDVSHLLPQSEARVRRPV